MITRDHPTGHWFVVARSYPTAFMARMAWERTEEGLDLSQGDEGIGIMRLAPREDGGAPTGAPEGQQAVVVITVDEPTAHKAERLLRGNEWEPTPDFMDALIWRRTRLVGDIDAAHPGQGGRLVIRRPDRLGALLDPSGIVHEQEPGRG